MKWVNQGSRSGSPEGHNAAAAAEAAAATGWYHRGNAPTQSVNHPQTQDRTSKKHCCHREYDHQQRRCIALLQNAHVQYSAVQLPRTFVEVWVCVWLPALVVVLPVLVPHQPASSSSSSNNSSSAH
jgi:hypothetical protein